jgi:hypothetical protein
VHLVTLTTTRAHVQTALKIEDFRPKEDRQKWVCKTRVSAPSAVQQADCEDGEDPGVCFGNFG